MTQQPPVTGSSEDELMEEVGLISGDIFSAIKGRTATASIIALTGSLGAVLETLPSDVQAQFRSNAIKQIRDMGKPVSRIIT